MPWLAPAPGPTSCRNPALQPGGWLLTEDDRESGWERGFRFRVNRHIHVRGKQGGNRGSRVDYAGFIKTGRLSQVTVPLCIPASRRQVRHILGQHTVPWGFVNATLSNRDVPVSHCGFNLHFLKDQRR